MGRVITFLISDVNLNLRYLVFQKDKEQGPDIFDIPHYKMLQKYLQVLGQDPHQRDEVRNVIVTIVVISIVGIVVPSSLEFYTSLCDKNMDAVIECLPHLIAAVTSLVKILNVHLNRENFKKIFIFVTKEWKELKLNNELHILEEIASQGSKMALIYRNTLLSFTVLFVLVPLFFPILDVVYPLNETRQRQQFLKVNYIFFDDKDYFFYVYIQLTWGAVITVLGIVTVDSLYILIIHHSSGLFAVCSHRVQKATRDTDLITGEPISESYTHEQCRNCIIFHHEAIQFYDILNESSQSSYLAQVGLNMMGISVTAVQTVANLDKPDEAFRTGVFLGAEQFHLFVISLPGQVLLDYCSMLADDIYGSMWYRIPVKIQKMLYTMQIRSKKPCALTAGGLYQMNMENFGITFKTCMSYFTMLMSLKE
ncbi:PREDICTED: uncharacterized protein LOC108546974 [Eufriesea mexicana]|uniref:uncharacterized protein LOC108546974 n=1 Tax=Eufriesea mexicana TaxID=516756 RepID=UPI00083C6208|nr:PREDICTED: uncharacterized protein LOC108546974 [Eufriesea mexicana]